jgi:PAS domain S-box-containing protein
LISSCPDPIFVTDLEGRVCFVNQPMVASLGEARSAIIGRHVSSWLPGGKAESADLLERLSRSGRLDEVEAQMRLLRGVIPVTLSIAPWMGADGRIQGYIGTAKDISERKREEEELVRMNLELSAIKVIADAVMGSLELDPLLSRALEAILKVTDAPMGMIFLRDEAEGRLHRRVYQGLSEGFVSAVPVAPDLIERLLDEERGVVVIEDVRRLQDDFARMRSEEGMRTTVYIPLLRKERLTGLIANAYREVREIDSARRRFLLAIGGIVGTAVENASLFERTQAQAQRLDAAHRDAQRRAEEIAALHHHSHSPGASGPHRRSIRRSHARAGRGGAAPEPEPTGIRGVRAGGIRRCTAGRAPR